MDASTLGCSFSSMQWVQRCIHMHTHAKYKPVFSNASTGPIIIFICGFRSRCKVENVYIRKTFLNFHFDPNLLLHQHCDQVTKWSFALQKSASFQNFCFIFSLNLNRKDFNLNLVCNLKSTESNNFIASWSIASVPLVRLCKKKSIFSLVVTWKTF